VLTLQLVALFADETPMQISHRMGGTTVKIGLDLDGVLCNFGARVIEAANALWPRKLAPNFVPDNWNYEGHLTKEEFAEVWMYIKARKYFWEDIPSLAGVQDLQDFLMRRRSTEEPRDELYFITARAITVGDPPLAQSAHWLQIHGLWPRDGFSTVIPVAEPTHKKDLFRGLGIRYMLDDYAPTIAELNELEGMHAFVLDQPWNRYADTLPRVYSVAEYLDKIRTIEKQNTVV